MRKAVSLFLINCIIWCLAACGHSQNSMGAGEVGLYYLSTSQTKLEMHEYVLQSRNLEEQVQEVLVQLSTVPDKLEYVAPFSLGISVLSHKVQEGKLLLDLSESYKSLKPTTEVLVRAAIVRSFTQLKGIDQVSVTIAGESLHDSLGNVVGSMSADMFIDNPLNTTNNYEKMRLKLYYANEAGDELVGVYKTLYHNSNVPVERLIVEEILSGPGAGFSEVYPTLNSDTKVLNITVKDGICYVNLDKAFLTQVHSVSADVAIYSIVNSLVETKNVSKVQILIEGNTNLTYRETYSLKTMFERNLDIISDGN